MTLAQEERAALVESMRAVGPDAPTLCEGWTTRDLAAHIVVRERRPDSGLGILIKPLAGYTESVRAKAAQEPWDALLDKVASGPPIWSPMRPVDRWANLAEMFVHHEDVLRGAAGRDSEWTPRVLSDELQHALLGPAKMVGRMSLKNAPARTTLRTPDGREVVSGGQGGAVTITGTPGELVLFAYGRAPVALEFDGDEALVSAVKDSERGI